MAGKAHRPMARAQRRAALAAAMLVLLAPRGRAARLDKDVNSGPGGAHPLAFVSSNFGSTSGGSVLHPRDHQSQLQPLPPLLQHGRNDLALFGEGSAPSSVNFGGEKTVYLDVVGKIEHLEEAIREDEAQILLSEAAIKELKAKIKLPPQAVTELELLSKLQSPAIGDLEDQIALLNGKIEGSQNQINLSRLLSLDRIEKKLRANTIIQQSTIDMSRAAIVNLQAAIGMLHATIDQSRAAALGLTVDEMREDERNILEHGRKLPQHMHHLSESSRLLLAYRNVEGLQDKVLQQERDGPMVELRESNRQLRDALHEASKMFPDGSDERKDLEKAWDDVFAARVVK